MNEGQKRYHEYWERQMADPAFRHAYAEVQAAKSDLRTHFGSVPPHQRPEDFAALREAFERGVAQDARTRSEPGEDAHA